MLVSVIIPVFNEQPDEIEKSILSVINQSYKEIEIIVIDDCSKFSFSQLRTKYDFPNFHWIVNPENMGVAYSRNRAVKHSKGEFIAFLDTGDTWEKSKLERQIQLYTRLGTENQYIIYTGAYVRKDRNINIRKPFLKGNIFPKILTVNHITGSNSSVLMKKSAFEEVGGYDTSIELPEDWDLWIRLSKKYHFHFIPQPLVNIYINPGSRSSDVKKKQSSYFTVICKYKNEIIDNNLLSDCLACYYYSLAQVTQKNSEYQKTIYFSIKAVLSKPSLFYLYILFKRLFFFNRLP